MKDTSRCAARPKASANTKLAKALTAEQRRVMLWLLPSGGWTGWRPPAPLRVLEGLQDLGLIVGNTWKRRPMEGLWKLTRKGRNVRELLQPSPKEAVA